MDFLFWGAAAGLLLVLSFAVAAFMERRWAREIERRGRRRKTKIRL